jgi:hypothetical protein
MAEPGAGRLPYLAFGRVTDHVVLASLCTMQEEKEKIEDIFKRLLEASRQKLASGQRQRLQWNSGSVCCLLDSQGICLYSLVTESVDYPERLAFSLLQEFMQDVQLAHGAQLESAGPYSLNKPMHPRMQELLTHYEDPKLLDPKLQSVTAKSDHIKHMMQKNIRKALETDESLNALEASSTYFAEDAAALGTRARRLRKKLWCQRFKLLLLFGAVIGFVAFMFRGGGSASVPRPTPEYD